MSTYYFGSGITYRQYLQAKSFVSDVTTAQLKSAKTVQLAVTRQTREMIASQEALASENIRTLEAGFGKVAAATQEGFEQLSWEIQDVSRGVSELNASFQWGFGEMLNQLTRLNGAVSELVKLAKTPIQTEANEYFQNARDALRRGLYREALEEAEKAISKHRLEWRYYSLAGRIHLGDISGGVEFLDLAKAENYFLLASRYAKADNPDDAARSSLAASWAAYCQGEMGRALTHAEEAISSDPRLAEALFQSGKVHMALGEPDIALPLLRKAIELDKCYALKAAADGDFQRHEFELREFLEALRQEITGQIRPHVEAELSKYAFGLSRSEELRRDPTFVKAGSFVVCALPLWDLLSERDELLKLGDVLAQRSGEVRVFERTEGPGLLYQSAKTGPEIVRTQTHIRRESVNIRDATGRISARIDFCPVPPACFKMWRPQTAGLRSVRLTRPFLLSATAITVGQYESLFRVGSKFDSSLPVVEVTWYEAIAYCNALSRAVGLEEAYTFSPHGVWFKGVVCQGYRLPTEAEWELACMADLRLSGDIKPFSDADIDRLAWMATNSGGKIHTVAAKQPNRWGLFDMLGNVCEWVFDWHVDAWANEEVDPIGPNEPVFIAKLKVTRGGFCNDSRDYLRWGATARPFEPIQKSPIVGFRIARTAPQQEV